MELNNVSRYFIRHLYNVKYEQKQRRIKKILLVKAKELLKKDKEDLENYLDNKKGQNIENEKNILEIEKQLKKQKEQENRDFKEFY